MLKLFLEILLPGWEDQQSLIYFRSEVVLPVLSDLVEARQYLIGAYSIYFPYLFPESFPEEPKVELLSHVLDPSIFAYQEVF